MTNPDSHCVIAPRDEQERRPIDQVNQFGRTGKHEELERHRTVAIVRDIVEVVAILAAGAWAIYTFVYEQRIKPANEPPALLLTGSLQRLGNRGDMIQVAFHATVRNIGHSRVYIIADGFAATGIRYTRKGTPATVKLAPGLTEYDRSARVLYSTAVYRIERLTRYASKAYGTGYDIDPAESIPYSGTFFVRKGDFDALELDGSVAYTKSERIYPTSISHLPNGAVFFRSITHDPDYHSLQVTLDRATLW